MQRALRAIAALAIALLANGPVSAGELRVLAFNVLAPIWASPVWYPDDLDPALLDAAFRRGALTRFLASEAPEQDVVCLQEVSASELPHLVAALGTDFEALMSVNAPDFWSSYLDGLPWEPNGTALAVRRDAFRSLELVDLALGDGNHATLAYAVHAATGRPVRIASVHLDSDRTNNRRSELLAVLDAMPTAPDAIDLVCGDINEDTVTGTAAGVAKRAGFADVLASVGAREATHPFTSSYNAAQRWAIIDHVLARGAEPIAGGVFDFGVWAIEHETARIAENLRRCGSDHFPIAAAVRF